MGLFTKLFGSHSERELKKLTPIADKVESLAVKYKSMSDSELKSQTELLKSRLKTGETLDEILPDAFAVVREASDRVLGMRPFRVQIIGGIVLHQGRIAEMKTGEGKTLVATLPAYLNALAGNGVHIVTVNDYLARRDSEWMGKVYRFLGLSVGLIVHGLSSEERQAAYAADITYGTNNEMGFDYLRDNMAIYKNNRVQRGHSFAIVDEVDSILIDEARTPLIISGTGEESTALYRQVDAFVRTLKRITFASVNEKEEESEDLDADYVVDEKAHTATLTARGTKKAEQAFNLENLADLENSTLAHHINQALKAHGIMHRDIDYIVKDGEVLIVDEFTGRLMYGRRYSEGLHQAIEAKENVNVARESKTLATITFQNYFRMYAKLSGMTGTALTEEEEFGAIYNLDIVEIPTNRPLVRIDDPDVVYKNENGKYRAIIEQIKVCHEKGQPVLVGTISIEKSELLSSMLKKTGIPHNVLNAKQHDKEAEIVAQAGRFGAVTIATNMAGRGTDIKLGGNPEFLASAQLRKAEIPEDIIAEATGYADTDKVEILAAREMYRTAYAKYAESCDIEAEKVRAAGGLFIIGTERHESRRIDNQLRGRSGRQGDPGETRFYISLTDDIMRLFGSERIMGMMETLGIDEDTPIDQKVLSNAIEQAQKKVESRNFQSRKSVLEYDDVMNKQREIIYDQRRRVLDGEDVDAYIKTMLLDVINFEINAAIGEHDYLDDMEQFSSIIRNFEGVFLENGELSLNEEDLNSINKAELTELLNNKALDFFAKREEELGLLPGTDMPIMRELERVILLRVVDEYWMDHIDAMSELRRGIGLRAYGQSNPVDEYKREGFDMFESMVNSIKHEVVFRICTVKVNKQAPIERKQVAAPTNLNNLGGDDTKKQPVRRKKIGRNEPCPCGSGKKYKNCCGR